MKNDLNLVVLEGKLLYPVDIEKKNGKVAFNFVIGVQRHTSSGIKTFRFSCVNWDASKEEFFKSLPVYSRLKITGHLQENRIVKSDGSKFTYCKVCADVIEKKAEKVVNYPPPIEAGACRNTSSVD